MKNLKKTSILIIMFFIFFSNQAFAAKIVIDPGHGGRDPGAIGVNGLSEKTVNMDISLKLQKELVNRGYQVVLTRTSDKKISLDERVLFKEANKADLFVSIHANSYHNTSAKGSLVLYYDHRYPNIKYPASPAMAALSSVNRQFAQYVLEGLVKQAETENRGMIASSARVVRLGTMPSILVETAFLSNRDDIIKLSSGESREKMAVGIANGIEKFQPVSGFKDVIGHWAFQSIHRLNEKGIVLGSNDKFSPERPLTRAEFLTMMDRVFEFSLEFRETQDEEMIENEVEGKEIIPVEEEDNEVQKDQNIIKKSVPTAAFKDMESSHWAFPVLENAVAHGYIQGYPDGSIRPNQAITRAEVSVLFDRIWNKDSEKNHFREDIQLFDDVPNNKWFSSSVYRLKEASILRGISETTFIPDRYMSRAEIAAMIDRYVERFDTHS